jgi:hypothetical protein
MRRPWRVVFLSFTVIALLTGAAVSDQLNWNPPIGWALDGILIAPECEEVFVGDHPELWPAYSLVEDGSGGAIIVYMSEPFEGDDDEIYAQKVDSVGDVQWGANGAPVCTTEVDNRTGPRAVTDGAGGIVASWLMEHYDGPDELRAQRLNQNGDAQWGGYGVQVAENGRLIGPQLMAPDGSGGAFVAWVEGASDFYGWQDGEDTLRVQYVQSSGSLPWGPSGVKVAPEDESEYEIVSLDMASDGTGGAILAWSADGDKVVATRLGSGGILWTSLVQDWMLPIDVSVCSDGAGGAYIAWAELRNFLSYDIYVQKLDSSGNRLWQVGGVPVCTALGDQIEPDVISDGAGGAIVAWMDERVYGDRDVYAGRVDASGTSVWTSNGVKLCSASGLQERSFADVVPDGFGGAIVTWEDWRKGYESDIYAQRIDSSGQFLYFADGLEICTAESVQFMPAVVPDGSGGAIIAWADFRDFERARLYAQRMTNTGELDGGWRDLSRGNRLYQNFPNPFDAGTEISFTLENYSHVRLQVFDAAGRLVRTIMDGPAKPPVHREGWDGRDNHGRPVPAGTYFYRIQGDGWTDTKKMMVVR